jgi:hypothetical protein
MWLKWQGIEKIGKGEQGVQIWQRGNDGNGIEASNYGESRQHRSLMKS